MRRVAQLLIFFLPLFEVLLTILQCLWGTLSVSMALSTRSTGTPQIRIGDIEVHRWSEYFGGVIPVRRALLSHCGSSMLAPSPDFRTGLRLIVC